MKATIALIIAFMVFMVVSIVGTLLVGSFDIYAVLSLVLLVPYFILLVFCRRGRGWAYLGSAILSILLLALIPLSLEPELSPLIMWSTTLATLIFVLMALEGFKAYTEAKKP